VKKETFCEILEGIDTAYIAESGMQKKARRRTWMRWAAAAACLGMILSGALALYRAEHPYPVKELEMAPDSSSETGEIPLWEDREIYAQYPEIILNDLQYQAGKGEVPLKQLGKALGSIAAKGWDDYAEMAGEDAVRYCDAMVYEIQNISVECAIAVQYAGTDLCYSAVNDSWRPDTLGQFIEELDLQNTLVVHWASYAYQKPFGGTANIRFEGLDTDMVLGLLLSDTAAENEYSDLDFDLPQEILGLCVSIPLLGYENISISVREDGYVLTNILSTGKMFCVGEDNTQAFVDDILRECDGYEIVCPSDSSPKEIPE